MEAPPVDDGLSRPPELDATSPFVWNANVGAAIGLILGVGSLANSAGVGGGAIFIPVLQALVGFGLKDATAISQALITAGGVVSVAINLFKRSPIDPNLPLINFSAALSLTPAVLAGVAVGVLLNTILPVTIITLLLLLLMSAMVLQTSAKAMKMWAGENAKARALAAVAAPPVPSEVVTLTFPSPQAQDLGTPTAVAPSGRKGFAAAAPTRSSGAAGSSGGGAGAAVTPRAAWVQQLSTAAVESWNCLEGEAPTQEPALLGATPAPVGPLLPSSGGAFDAAGQWASYGCMEGLPAPPAAGLASEWGLLQCRTALPAHSRAASAAPSSLHRSLFGLVGRVASDAEAALRAPLLLPGPADPHDVEAGVADTVHTPLAPRPDVAPPPRGAQRAVVDEARGLEGLTDFLAPDPTAPWLFCEEEDASAALPWAPDASHGCSPALRRSRARQHHPHHPHHAHHHHFLHVGGELGGITALSPGLITRAAMLRRAASGRSSQQGHALAAPTVLSHLSPVRAHRPPRPSLSQAGARAASDAATLLAYDVGCERFDPAAAWHAALQAPCGPHPAVPSPPPAATEGVRGLAGGVECPGSLPAGAGLLRRWPPMQPPLPAADAADILSRLDAPAPGWHLSSSRRRSHDGAPHHGHHPASRQPSTADHLTPLLMDTGSEGWWAESAGSGDGGDGSVLQGGARRQGWWAAMADVAAIMLADLCAVPWPTAGALAATWVVFSSLQIQRSRVVRCSPTFWALLLGQLAFMLCVSLATLFVPRLRVWLQAQRHHDHADSTACTACTVGSSSLLGASPACDPMTVLVCGPNAAKSAVGVPLPRHPPPLCGSAPCVAGAAMPGLWSTGRLPASPSNGAGPAADSPLGWEATGMDRQLAGLVFAPGGTVGEPAAPYDARGLSPLTRTVPMPDTAWHVASPPPGYQPLSPAASVGQAGAGGGRYGKPAENEANAGAEEDEEEEEQWETSVVGGSLAASMLTLGIAWLAGAVGGMLGLGGGMLIGPLLLELGFHPQAAAATSSLTVLFSSSAALLGFMSLGRLNVAYGTVLGAASAVASVLGVCIVSDLVRRSGRLSVVVFALAAVMMSSLACIATFGLMDMAVALTQSDALALTSMC